VCVTAPFVLDATETGELLPMSGTEYVTGFESREETGEPHAPPTAQPLNMQAVSACFAMEHRAGEDHTIERPERYAFWRDHEPPMWPGKLLDWTAPDQRTMEPYARRLVPNPRPDTPPPPGTPTKDLDGDLWRFRRILARKNFAADFYASDVTLVNWPMIDYSRGPIFEVPEEEAIRHVEDARQLSLSFLYWMQTEAPRPDGGTGYPGLRPRPDVVGTDDGLAKRLYVRESRRIRAEYTVVEQDLASEVRGDLGAKSYPDSVGVGAYRIDLHPSTGNDGYIDVGAHPFEIPLGALIPIRTRNLLPAAKNIGTTHITNGAYRLHPVEWTVGEVAGHLASFCLERSVSPSEVRAGETLLGEFQRRLTSDGGELRWPSSVHAL
jgi:FAD dependent oxidoreductase